MAELLREYPALLWSVVGFGALVLAFVAWNWRAWREGEVTFDLIFLKYKLAGWKAPLPPAPPPPLARNYLVPNPQAATTILEALKHQKFVLLHGAKGCGKYSFAVHLAHRLHDAGLRFHMVSVGQRSADEVREALAGLVSPELAREAGAGALKGRLDGVLSREPAVVFFLGMRPDLYDELPELLPPKNCAALITAVSPDVPPGAVDLPVPMPTLDDTQVMSLFAGGDESLTRIVAAERDAALELWALCDRKPGLLVLARASFARLVRNGLAAPDRPLRAFTDMERERLRTSEPDAKVLAFFDQSYQQLGEDDRRRFRRLGVFSSERGFTEAAAAHLWGMEAKSAPRELAALMDAHLIQRIDRAEHGVGTVARAADRYRLLHYAVGHANKKLAEVGETGEARAALADYLANLFAAHYRDDPATAPDVFLELDHMRQAARWAAQEHRFELLARLAVSVRNWMVLLSDVGEWQGWLEAALEARIADDVLRGRVLLDVGDAPLAKGEFEQARVFLQQAHDTFERVGSPFWRAVSLNKLGEVCVGDWPGRDYALARKCYADAIALFAQVRAGAAPGPKSGEWVGARLGECNALRALGDIAVMLGEHDQAREHHLAALAHAEAPEVSNQWSVAVSHVSMGAACLRRKDLAGALAHGLEALEQSRPVGFREGEAQALKLMGDAHAFRGEAGPAGECYDKAMAFYERQGMSAEAAAVLVARGEMARRVQGGVPDPEELFRKALALCPERAVHVRAEAHRGLGCVVLGRPAASAADEFATALELYRKASDRAGEASALAGLGRAALRGGDAAKAAGYAEQARTVRRQMRDASGEGEDHEEAARLLLALGRRAEALAEADLAAGCYAALTEPALAARVGALQAQCRA